MIVYLARAIQAFVMYCVNGTSRSSLLIESTDSMIMITPIYIVIMFTYKYYSDVYSRPAGIYIILYDFQFPH